VSLRLNERRLECLCSASTRHNRRCVLLCARGLEHRFTPALQPFVATRQQRAQRDIKAQVVSTSWGSLVRAQYRPPRKPPLARGFSCFLCMEWRCGLQSGRAAKKSCAIRHLMTSHLAPGTARRCECWGGPALKVVARYQPRQLTRSASSSTTTNSHRPHCSLRLAPLDTAVSTLRLAGSSHEESLAA